MLSYRHAFHAGNHADVLKHFVLDQVLSYTAQKDKPFWYIDTHAGAGMYALDGEFASKNAEFRTGISKITPDKAPHTALKGYVDFIRQINTNKGLTLYPGSPAIAQQHLRGSDKMRLFELHPSDYLLLTEYFKTDSKQVKIEKLDGFTALKALLPPPSKRAVVLIDPPYEEKQDYQRVTKIIADCLLRFASGTYLVWYPLLTRPEPLQMVASLKHLKPKNWLNIAMAVQQPSTDGFGMFGSGLFIVNPPWTLPDTLRQVMQNLTNILALDDTAHFTLESELQ